MRSWLQHTDAFLSYKITQRVQQGLRCGARGSCKPDCLRGLYKEERDDVEILGSGWTGL